MLRAGIIVFRRSLERGDYGWLLVRGIGLHLEDRAEPKELDGIASEHFSLRFSRELTLSYQLANVLLTQRIGIVRAQHDLVLAHDIDKKLQATLVEDGRIDIEAI